MSARVTPGLEPSLLLRIENPMCRSDAKWVLCERHSAPLLGGGAAAGDDEHGDDESRPDDASAIHPSLL